MKLATIKNGTRDGALVVVSQNLSQVVDASKIAPTMQAALDNWSEVEAPLRALYAKLNEDNVWDAVDFKSVPVAAPLPRAYQWLDGSAYVNHVELVRKARGVEMPPSFWTDPLMYQGASDSFIGARDDVELADEAWGIDFEAEVAVITGDVPMGIGVAEARNYIRLVVLLNDVSLRYVAKEEMQKGFGFINAKPTCSFSPAVVTPDALGSAWDGGKLHLPLLTYRGAELFGKPNAGVDMVFDFPTLIAHAAKTRHLAAGSIIGSGTVSNKDRSVGSSCIVEKQTLEKLDTGEVKTRFLSFGEQVKIEMLDAEGKSIFGAIDQKIVRYSYQQKAA